jgi:hypothetical protein
LGAGLTLATQEAAIRKIVVPGQPRQMFARYYISKNIQHRKWLVEWLK